ncbi:MAG: hypothetical protein ACYC65_09355 [Candidatus Limnocylindrales bacterium]
MTAVATWTISGVVPGGTLPVAYVPGTDPMAAIGPLLPQLIVSTIVIGSVTMVAGWVYLAIAIAGLRGYRVLPGWILRRGVRTFAADLLMTVAFAAIFGVLALISIAGGPGLVLVVMITAFVPAVYVSIRLVFWSLAIFDGAGIAQGFQATWRISRAAVGRMLGWGVMVAIIGLLVRGVAEVVTTPLGNGSAIRAGITAAVTEAFAAYSMIALAVIYESQRRRTVLGSPMPSFGAPAARPMDPPAPTNPLDPPPPPAGWS